tara:strand:+ start:761 stop:2653 length:1893 start_codon:yes stop_codon:yes gene_type:complete
LSKASAIFDEMTSSETRARCPRIEPTGCQGRKKEFHVQVEQDHAFCHRCQYTWHFEDKKMDKPIEIKPPQVIHKFRTPVKCTDAVKKSGFVKNREDFLAHWKKVKKDLELPWSLESRRDYYGIGIRNNKNKMQLVFRIADNHIKRHKGEQFGDAECKIYPDIKDIDPTSTLLICEGEKDAVSANCYGFPAITFTSGAGGIPKDISSLDEFKSIVICYDADESGHNGAKKLAKILYRQDRNIKILELESDMDLTDYFSAGHSFHDLYSMIDQCALFGTDPADFGGDPMYKVFDFMDTFQKKVEYICDEILLENGRTSVAGGTNVGKSLFALQFAICVAAGVPFMTFQVPRPRRVLLVQFEMMDAMVTDRLKPMVNGILDKHPERRDTLGHNLTIISADKKQLFENAYEKITGNLLAAPEPFDVLIIDNLYTSSEVDTVKNDQLRNLISTIENIKKEFNLSVLVVAHHKKMAEKAVPMDTAMVFGGSFYSFWLDNLIQLASTFHEPLKVMKITKTRTNSEFHNIALGIKLVSDAEKEHLLYEYRQPLPKGEVFWYRDQENSDEDRVLDNIKSQGDNFTYEDMRLSLEETLHITSSASVSAWLKKLSKQERIIKLERGIYCKNKTDIEFLVDK